MSAGSDQFALSYQISPIILTGGIASDVPGGMVPIISLTESGNFQSGLLSGGGQKNPEDYFAQFSPVPGASLIEQDIGEYPFANQAVAANATITKPLVISVLMSCPARGPGSYAAKLATITNLRAQLAKHNTSGGTYTIATPSYIWTNCIMLAMRDASRADSRQVQNAWQLDFRRPLLTLEEATQVQNNLMGKITSATKINGKPAWSGLQPTIGNPPSLAAAAVVPAAQGTGGSGAASP